MANENVIHIGSEEAFEKLMAGDAPVLVDFWATWWTPSGTARLPTAAWPTAWTGW